MFNYGSMGQLPTNLPPSVRPPNNIYPPPFQIGTLSVSDFTLNCVNRFITIYPKQGNFFWYYPIQVTDNAIYGYIWAEFVWIPLILDQSLVSHLGGMNGGGDCFGPRFVRDENVFRREGNESSGMGIYKMSIVGDRVFHMYVKIDKRFSNNIMKAQNDTWDVISYRIKDNKTVEDYTPLGSGWKIGDNHLAVELTDSSMLTNEIEYLTNSNPLSKKALIFISKGIFLFTQDFLNATKKTFDENFIPEIISSGFVAWPEEMGYYTKVLSCTCKGVFGGTSGCTSPQCNVVLGICQSNPDCKKTDLTSICSCH